MKVVFVSNFLNHHQTFLCEEFIKRCDEFSFVATKKTANGGFQKPEERPYVLHDYNEDEKEEIERKILSADVVIFGSCPNRLIEMRMRENKLSFLFSERFLKKGTWRRWIPQTRKSIQNRIAKYKDKNMYVLSASAYLSYDLSLFGFPQTKCLRWGYFPETNTYDKTALLQGKGPATLLWCGRFLQWKHPETALRVAKRLKKDGYTFQLTMVGDGEQKPRIETLVKKWKLTDCVTLVGAKTPKEVRAYMEKSRIFLATSNRYEGWGAVVNEAMNSGCAVVATRQMGAVPFLVQDGFNGYTFVAKKDKQAYQIVKRLLEDNEQCACVGSNAYATIHEEWNAKNAVCKLLQFIESVQNGNVCFCEQGVCSQAKMIKG